MKNCFNRELAMNKEDDENFESSIKQWICNNTFAKSGVKERDQRCSTQRS